VGDLRDSDGIEVEVIYTLRQTAVCARLQLVCDVAARDGTERQNIGLGHAAESKVDVAQGQSEQLCNVAIGVPALPVLSLGILGEAICRAEASGYPLRYAASS
jgi:hypothetical protein